MLHAPECLLYDSANDTVKKDRRKKKSRIKALPIERMHPAGRNRPLAPSQLE
jgi:ribosomal protein L20